MSRRDVGSEPRAREVLDEAIHLLRSAPLSTFLAYYTGTGPFVITGLYFIFDMSRNAYAGERCAPLSLALALAFVWMKVWQASFARRLRAQLAGVEDKPWSLREAARVASSQTFLQSTGVVVLPIALLFLIAFPWPFAYYQNATALADGENGSVRSLHRRAWQQMLLWPGQNFSMVGVHSILSLVVFANWILMMLLVPFLIQTLLGLEANPTLAGLQEPNVTTHSVAAALTHLVVDPMIKAAYVLRCFQGESVASGADLLADMAKLRSPGAMSKAAVLLAIAMSVLPGGGSALAQEAPADVGARIEKAELDDAVDRVLSRSEYAWRLPRERAVTEEEGTADEGWLAGFARKARQMVKDFFEWLGKKVKGFLERLFGGRQGGATGGGLSLPDPTTLGILLLAATAVLLITAILVGRWKRAKSQAVTAARAVALPNIESEETLASDLPENEWLRLAEDLLGRGELRLALRALHLAGLSFLAGRRLIAIARFKSDRDYERELSRKAHALPVTATAFSENVRSFERVWYGTHAATPEGFAAFRASLDRLRGES